MDSEKNKKMKVCVGCEEQKEVVVMEEIRARLKSLDRCSISDIGQLWGAFLSL